MASKSNRGLSLVPARESACRDIACSQTGSCRSSGWEEKRAREVKLVEERAEDRRKAEIQHKKLSQDLADWSSAETLRDFVQRLETEIEKDPTRKSEFAEPWIDR